MPLKLKLRGKVWHIEGRIDEVPDSPYHRTSTRRSKKEDAQTYLNWFRTKEVDAYKNTYFGNTKKSLIFAEAVQLYDPRPDCAKHLLKVMPYLEELEVDEISPRMVRDLGKQIAPYNSTDTWHRQFITPVRAVINNAHDLGLCNPIRIKGYTTHERHKQDKFRNKLSRVPKTPGSWHWLLDFQEAADPYTGLLAELIFCTGARISEACRLTPADVNYEENTVYITVTKDHDPEWTVIPETLSAALMELPPKRPKHRYIKSRKFEERIFGFASKDSVYEKWHRAIEKANIEKILPHASGRHGFATELHVRKGLDAPTVAKGGRWKTASLVSDTYAHSEDGKKRILDALRTGRAQAEKARQSKPLDNIRKS